MAQDSDRVEVGAFVDFFRLSNNAAPVSKFLGVGGGPAFNVNPNVQLEAEVAYDFKRNYTRTFSNGITRETVNSNFRTLHGFFGPKFRVFVTGKVGFDNFSINNQNPQTGFTNIVGLSRLNQWGDLFRALPGGRNGGFCWSDWSAG